MPKAGPAQAGDTPTPAAEPAVEQAEPTREQLLAAAAGRVGQPNGPTREQLLALAEAAAYDATHKTPGE